jgi:TonB family protein
VTHWPRRKNLAVLFLFLAGTVLAIPSPCFGQGDQPASNRKIINKVLPQYPSWARSMNLRGIVKVEAIVSGNGVVKAVEVKGGHPVLVQSAMDAVRKWKWEPASRDSREFVEVRFSPE